MSLRSFSANSASDVLTSTAHGLVTGDVVRVFPVDGTAALPGGLVENVPYAVIKIDGNSLKLAVNATAANYGTAVDLSNAGTSTCVIEKERA